MFLLYFPCSPIFAGIVLEKSRTETTVFLNVEDVNCCYLQFFIKILFPLLARNHTELIMIYWQMRLHIESIPFLPFYKKQKENKKFHIDKLLIEYYYFP